MLSWMAIDCPSCPAKKGQRCRTLTTNRVTDTHILRMDRWDELRKRRREQGQEETL